MTDRKKPGVAFWAIVLVVGLLVGYPLSFGPACWISSRSGSGGSVVNSAYQPILDLAFHRSNVIGRGALWYAQLLSNGQWVVGYVSGRYEWCKMPL